MSESYTIELEATKQKDTIHVVAKASCGDEAHNQSLGVIRGEYFTPQPYLKVIPIDYMGQITLKYALWHKDRNEDELKDNTTDETDSSEKIKRMPGVDK